MFFQDASEETLNSEGEESSGYVDINITAAVLFVVFASGFLVMLYKLMSFWFVEVLVVLFCIGGVEVWPYFALFVDGQICSSVNICM